VYSFLIDQNNEPVKNRVLRFSIGGNRCPVGGKLGFGKEQIWMRLLESHYRFTVLVLMMLVLLTVAFACQSQSERQHAAARQAMKDMQISTPAERGKYLVTIAGCSECHTPFKMGEHGPEPDMTRYLSGHPQDMKLPPAPTLPPGPWIMVGAATNTAFHGPWGTTFAANLTPDLQTGLGVWTEDMFIKAMRTGRHMSGGRMIQPPMPWQGIGQMTDSDLKAVYAYLRTVPKISNMVPDYEPPAHAPAHE
jgi:mono/diheme cytochrome c family protein